MEHKVTPAIKDYDFDEGRGEVRAIVNVTGIVDHTGDVVAPTAVDHQVRGEGTPVRVCESHDWSLIVGACTRLERHLPGSAQVPRDLGPKAGTIVATAKLALNTYQGRECWERLKFFSELEEHGLAWSVGFTYREEDAWIDKATGYRHLDRITIWEVSPVLAPASPGTRTLSVRGMDQSRVMVPLPASSWSAMWRELLADPHDIREGYGDSVRYPPGVMEALVAAELLA